MPELRAEFPVFERLAYLNAGTNGPVPARAVEAATAALRAQAEEGRGGGLYIDAVVAEAERLRARMSALLGCAEGELALTGSTTDGVNTVLSALDLGEGDEVLTSDEEHPGLLAPLGLARERSGVRIRVAPFASLASAVSDETRLIACSHVSWISGNVVDAAALAASEAPVLLDGAQGLGAVPVDVEQLGCDFYAASGQKWPCGPNGLGYLYVRRVGDLLPPRAGFGSLSDADRPLDLELHQDARRFDAALPASHQLAWAHAALDVLEAAGFPEVHAHAAQTAQRLARELEGRGLAVAPRGSSTLVSWEQPDPEATVERLLRADVVVRYLPQTPYVRASVGGWTDDGDLERLLSAL